MAELNNQRPNSDIDINRVSRTVDQLVDNLPRNIAPKILGTDYLAERSAMLVQMVENVDRPILAAMAKDVLNVLNSWFQDSTVMCCLIRGLFSIHASTWAKSKVPKNGTIELGQGFIEFLDMLIAFIDLIIVILTNDVRGFALGFTDFIKDIMNGVFGAVLVVLQETLFALRDTLLDKLLRALSVDTELKWWAKCLQLNRFIDILKRYVHDYGLLADLMNKIRGYNAGIFAEWEAYLRADFVKNINDLEFLYWLRELLYKLKQAVVQFDLCIEYEYVVVDPNTNQNRLVSQTVPIQQLLKQGSDLNKTQAQQKQGIVIANDGTILVDSQKLKGLDNGSIPVLSSSSIRTFMNKYYGVPLEVADSILAGGSSQDSIMGTNINSDRVTELNADCPNSATPDEIVTWAQHVRNRVK